MQVVRWMSMCLELAFASATQPALPTRPAPHAQALSGGTTGSWSGSSTCCWCWTRQCPVASWSARCAAGSSGSAWSRGALQRCGSQSTRWAGMRALLKCMLSWTGRLAMGNVYMLRPHVMAVVILACGWSVRQLGGTRPSNQVICQVNQKVMWTTCKLGVGEALPAIQLKLQRTMPEWPL